MSVAAIRPPSAIYHEEQYFAWWLYALLAAMVGLGWVGLAWHRNAPHDPPPPAAAWSLEVPVALAVGLVLPSVLLVGVLRMTTEVTPTDCRVWFGWIPTYRRLIVLNEIQSIEVVRYNAIRDHGFWGVRKSRDGERAFTARGDRGVRLVMSDGSRILIGSQQPELLARALEQALRLEA